MHAHKMEYTPPSSTSLTINGSEINELIDQLDYSKVSLLIYTVENFIRR